VKTGGRKAGVKRILPNSHPYVNIRAIMTGG